MASVADRAAWLALLALAALLPFEPRRGVAFGPLSVTPQEAALYLAVLLGGARLVALRRMPWGSMAAAVALWAAALTASAIAAPAHGAAAVKFALRSLGGCALFWVAADAVASAARVSALFRAVLAGALLSAASAIAEAWVPGGVELVAPFRLAETPAVPARASGTLGYPTLASMFWEASLPLLWALWSLRARGWGGPLGAAAALALGEALVLAGSRAGLFITVAGAAVLAARAATARGRRAALAGLAGVAALILADVAVRPGWASRLRGRADGVWYRAELTPRSSSLEAPAGEVVAVRLAVRNRGALDWDDGRVTAPLLSYQWVDAAERTVAEGPFVALGRAVRRGEQAEVSVPVRMPDRPGRYTLRWQLGRRGFVWDLDPGGAVTAVATGPGRGGASPGPSSRRPVQRQITRLELWATALRALRDRPLLGLGPGNFRRTYSAYLGPVVFDERVQANSLYLGTLAELGLAGGVALTLLVAATVRTLLERHRSARDERERVLVIGAAAGLAAYGVHGLVDDFLAFTPAYGLFWLLLAVAAGPWRREDS